MATAPTITPEIVAKHGLSPGEYELVKQLLGREPNLNELGVFSVMWSEHCGYKNSRPLIKKLPTSGPAILQGPGENAGIVDIGDGWAVVFKIESHNHPSAVEPYQGAATGVGGILRDIFTMGARPIAMLNSLRFGDPGTERTRRLVQGVVKGIGDYGNCVGVPTVAGEINFDPAYEDNILVNAMCVGVIRHGSIVRARADRVGDLVFYFGSTTGRDGIHGATFASEELSEDGEDKRPSVQVGDPFMEKLLLEATLELITRGLVEGIQDMGAAGLTSSSCEMAARSGRGIEFSLDEIPKRADDLTAYEMLLSESQERMLAVVREENLAAIREVLERWDLHGVVIGRVTDSGHLVVRHHGEVVADIPVDAITGNVPQYTREVIRPAYLDEARILPPIRIDDWARTFLEMLGMPDIASKEWAYGQYDYMVRNDTVVPPGGAGAAVVRLKETGKGIAMTTDCNAGYCWLDPRRGAMIAVAEAARNLAAVGARPLAVTNNLNFSNPEKSPIYYQLAECLAGMGEACRAFDTPVTGGNASLYNETAGRPILPTPVIGMVGLLEDVGRHCRAAFRAAGGDELWLLGTSREELGGSQLVRLLAGRIAGECPAIDLATEKKLVDCVVSLVGEALLLSCSDLAEGGLLIAAAEGAIAGGVGFTLDYHPAGLSPEAAFFGESQGRFLVSVDPAAAATLSRRLETAGIPAQKIGVTGGRMLAANGLLEVPLATASDAWRNAIRHRLEGTSKNCPKLREIGPQREDTPTRAPSSAVNRGALEKRG